MRRFASVFRKKDKDPAKAELKRANTALPAVPPVLPVLSSGSEPASSASSNGSASLSLSLQTPDDEHDISGTLSKGARWPSWLGKKSGTIKRGRPGEEPWVAEWRPSEPPPILNPPPRPQQPKVVVDSDDDDDDDASSLDAVDDEQEDLPITPASPAQARKNVEILTRNSLVRPPESSPFAQHPATPVYPRSVNAPRSLSVRLSMETEMHKTLLLRRIHQSALDDPSILPFASRTTPTPADPHPPTPWHNDRFPAAKMRISLSSSGLRRWMARPCFEERINVWVPVNDALSAQPVAGSSFAVAELEYSATLEALAGSTPLPAKEEQPAAAPAALAPSPQSLGVVTAAPPAPVRTSSLVPSPLRNSALKSPVSETGSHASAPSSAPPTASRVRFAEDDKDDVIPLGYTIRLKKRREDKAKFLREEQERRAFEEERAKQDEERRIREQERRQWEEERRAWEKEKKAMEEERKARIYAEEVAASRVRREQQRAGHGVNSAGVLADVLPPSSSNASLREERNKPESGKLSRPLHDQRRQASDPAVHHANNTPSGSPHTSSPGSSRPPSIAGRNSSRPPSVYTSSSEDARQPSSSAGKHHSISAFPSKGGNFERSSTYGMWSASNPTLMIPPVPPVPMFAMDMPLLPPTPPFMMHQYPRPRSQNSHNSSPGRSSPSASPSRQRYPSNSSSERVNIPHRADDPSSRRGSSSSSHRPDVMQHHRRGSDDARRASIPVPPSSYSNASERGRAPQHHSASMRSQSSSNLGARGRPPIPQTQLQEPSPWTAPPSTTGYSQLNRTSGHEQRPSKPGRRQTTIS
ncbi:hypothetical protein FB45DRAFT_904218 [Roridomyces roridus]|uniref:Uncharacterized protein n=1 Tax=Roridomyces roridus TaxID=1738132 RepID=A0AAD7C527_9AGAR|nr:hypothetical protein FB45DRAFT_904218 [Roridomyces roridus]